MPIETSEPIPAASSPGISSSFCRAPPIPVASIRTIAAISGEPKTIDTAEKIPQAATSVTMSAGASLRSRRIPSTPRPAPSAISGASGPSTSPSPIVASAASMTPGMSIGSVGVEV